jgi:hypothetical protein
MHLHLQRDKRKKGIASPFTSYNLHRFGPAFKLFIQPLNDIGRSQADPFILGEMKKRQTGLYGSLEALDGRRQFFNDKYFVLVFVLNSSQFSLISTR